MRYKYFSWRYIFEFLLRRHRVSVYDTTPAESWLTQSAVPVYRSPGSLFRVTVTRPKRYWRVLLLLHTVRTPANTTRGYDARGWVKDRRRPYPFPFRFKDSPRDERFANCARPIAGTLCSKSYTFRSIAPTIYVYAYTSYVAIATTLCKNLKISNESFHSRLRLNSNRSTERYSKGKYGGLWMKKIIVKI